MRFLAGAVRLKAFRLSPEASAKRVIATCCNSPVFLEVRGGHWLSLYGKLWPGGSLPSPEMRTTTSDLPDSSVLPDDIPNAKKQSLKFFSQAIRGVGRHGFSGPENADDWKDQCLILADPMPGSSGSKGLWRVLQTCFARHEWRCLALMMMTHPDRAMAKRAMEAMMTMQEIDIAAIEAAAKGS